MRIAWIVSAQSLQSTPAGLHSRIASYRYRMIIPATELKKRGHEVVAIGVSSAAGGYEYAVKQLQRADVVVFGKMWDLALQARLIDAVRKRAIGAVVDVCDDHFGTHASGLSYGSVAASGDAVSVSSSRLAARVAEVTGCAASVIVDPFEGAWGAPKWAPGAILNVLWFGHESNLIGLDKALGGIARSGIALRLVVVTTGIPAVLEWCRKVSAGLSPDIRLEFREWSLETTAQSLRECDMVLLPIDLERKFSLSKGPNRIVEALWAGRFVAAHPLPAYEEFAEWAWVGEEIAAGIGWALNHSAEIVDRIERAQEYIRPKFSPRSVAEAWDELLTTVHERRRSRID
jgi:glycosyltransferase involved in cell wall biosynthesis